MTQGEASESLDTGIWGEPPSTDKLERARAWNNQERKRKLQRVLDTTWHLDEAAEVLDIGMVELQAKADNKVILGINLGEAGYFIPTWQFITDEHGTLAANPIIYRLWDLWGRDMNTLLFCQFMTYSHPDRQPYLQVVVEPIDEHALIDLELRAKFHGVLPM